MSIKVLALIIIIVILGVVYYLFPLIQVVGDSMYPTYHNGEILLGTRLYRKSKLKKGDVIVYTSPEDRIVIKRIDKTARGKYYRIGSLQFFKRERQFYCLGDNSEHSYDSRNYGFISSRKLKCKVVNQRRKVKCM